jgi:hypothetical protein
MKWKLRPDCPPDQVVALRPMRAMRDKCMECCCGQGHARHEVLQVTPLSGSDVVLVRLLLDYRVEAVLGHQPHWSPPSCSPRCRPSAGSGIGSNSFPPSPRYGFVWS